MYPSKAYDELKKEMAKIDNDYRSLYESIHPLDHGYEVASTHPVQEDINIGLGLDALFAGRKINKATKKNYDDLRKTIRDNDMRSFNRAIKFGKFDLSHRDQQHYTLLDWSIHYNNPVALNILLREGADPNEFHPSVGLPILNALSTQKTYHDKHACAHLLISAYADLHKIDERGENGVMKIIKLKLKDLYKKLSYYHIEYCPLTSNGETMLHYAARYGDNEMIQKTLSSHLKIKDRTSTQETILHILAARDNKEEFIKKAIQEGINVNAVDVIGNTALHYACENAQYKNTELLLKNGANPLAVNFNQEKPSDKLKHTTSNNYQSIAKTATLLSETVNNAYQQILEGKIPHPKLIASQKPLFDLSNKSNQHTPE